MSETTEEAFARILRTFIKEAAPIIQRMDDLLTEQGQRAADEAEAWLAERTKR